MSVFVAVVAYDNATPELPDSCVSALQLPGAGTVTRRALGGFHCATAPTRGERPVCAEGSAIVTGDVRLDGRAGIIGSLRPLLRDTARRPVDASDDVAIVHAAYRAWGLHSVERLRGEFSFVVWDSATRTLVAARDGLGVRPMYYATFPGGICLSNALDAVRGHPSVGGGLNIAAVTSFLEVGWNRDTSTTTFSEVARLPPGTMLSRTAESRVLAVGAHWRMPDPAPIQYRRAEDYVEHFRALLADAVRDRVTGPTAILLSGGLDSTSMAATAARVSPGCSLYALTTRMPQVESPEEARLATAVARQLGIRHEVREYAIEPRPGESPRTPEPYDDFELRANMEFYAMLGRHAPVGLIGEDGDALFAPPGLRTMVSRYGAFSIAATIAMHMIRHGYRPYLGLWLRRRLSGWGRTAAHRPAWIRSPAAPAAEAPPRRHAARPSAARRLSSSLWQRLHQGTDRAFSRAPLEVRWPFLDARLIEFVFAIPPVPWCQRKYLMRRAYASELPAEVVRRPKTTIPGYFEVAAGAWRANRASVFAPSLHAHTREYVDAARLADALATGDAEAVHVAWRALTLDRWIRDLEAA